MWPMAEKKDEKVAKPKDAAKPKSKGAKRDYRGIVIVLVLALLFIGIGYFSLQKPQASSAVPKSENLTPNVPLNTSGGCPLYEGNTPQTFSFQIFHKDKTTNPNLMYTLQYHCDCASDCAQGCGYNYTDITGNNDVPIIRFSDTDGMDLLVGGQVVESFNLKCTQTQTVIYLTDEECSFSYNCYFFNN